MDKDRHQVPKESETGVHGFRMSACTTCKCVASVASQPQKVMDVPGCFSMRRRPGQLEMRSKALPLPSLPQHRQYGMP